VNTGYDVDVYDVDLLETSPDVLDGLRAEGRMVVCYFTAGTWETFRDDPAPAAEAIGLPLPGFPDERWLDIRHDAVPAPWAGSLEPAFRGFSLALRPPLPAGDAGGPVLTPSGGTAESPQVDAARGEIAAIEGP